MCSMTGSWGGGVPNLVIDYYKPKLCLLLLRSYFPVPHVRPSHRQTSLQGRFCIMPCTPTPPVSTQHRIVSSTRRPPSLSHHIKPVSSLHTGESMLDKYIYQAMDIIHILPSIHYTIFLIMVFPSLLHDSIPHPGQIWAYILPLAMV